MKIFVDGKEAVLKKGTSFEFIAENRLFSGADEYTLSITFPIVDCPQNRAIFGAFAKNLIPRSYLVGKDGQVVYVTKGYTAEEFAELMEQIEKALK